MKEINECRICLGIGCKHCEPQGNQDGKSFNKIEDSGSITILDPDTNERVIRIGVHMD